MYLTIPYNRKCWTGSTTGRLYWEYIWRLVKHILRRFQ